MIRGGTLLWGQASGGEIVRARTCDQSSSLLGGRKIEKIIRSKIGEGKI